MGKRHALPAAKQASRRTIGGLRVAGAICVERKRERERESQEERIEER